MEYDLREGTILKEYISARLEFIKKNVLETPEGGKLFQETAHLLDDNLQRLPKECISKFLKLTELFDDKADLLMRYAYLVGLRDGLNTDVIDGKIA